MDRGKSRRPARADLVGCQDPEGGDDLLGGVGVGRLSGHEVDEGLEGDRALSIGVHQGHDAGKLGFTLRQGCKETFTQEHTTVGRATLLLSLLTARSFGWEGGIPASPPICETNPLG